MKVIYYYQTFVGLDKLLTHREDVDVIIVSSIHFGKNKENQLGIYLNDNKPDNKPGKESGISSPRDSGTWNR